MKFKLISYIVDFTNESQLEIRILCHFRYLVFDRFVTNTEVQKLLFNEDQLSVKWGIEFYEEKGRFRRDLANLKASKAVE